MSERGKNLNRIVYFLMTLVLLIGVSASDVLAIDNTEAGEAEFSDNGVVPMSATNGYEVYFGTASGTLIGKYDTLLDACAAVNGDGSGADYTIRVTGDDPAMGATATVAAGKSVTLTSGTGLAFTITKTDAGRHVTVNGSLTLENIILDGDGVGGGVGVNGGNLVLDTGATIRNCYTSIYGGGIHAYDNAVVTLKAGSKVLGNEANANVNNYNTGMGGGIYAYPATLTMEKGAEVSGNTASHAGGIYTGGTASINGTVSSNISYRSGGGIYYVQVGTQVLSMDGADVTGNIAYGYSGTTSGTSYVGTGGGGLYIIVSSSTSGDIAIKNSNFSNNQAPTARNPSINDGQDYYTGHQFGGAIYVSNGKNVDTKLVLTGCTFTDNEARVGGALSLNCETEMTACVFDGNRAYNDRYNSESSGGAIYFNAARGNIGNTYLLRISGGAIKNGSAYNGAGISLTNANVYQVYVDGTEFENNQIVEAGYAWGVNNPTGYEAISQAVFGGLNYAELYKRNITNVTTATSPYTNIYDNADIQFMLYRVVSYNGNGGVFLYSDINSKFGTSYTTDLSSISFSYIQGELLSHPESIPYKEGDTFLGWYLEDIETPAPEDGTPVYENYRFYALWQSMLYTVTYDPGTAESVTNMPQPDTVTAAAGTSFTVSSNVPSRSGYNFTGWNTEADGSGTPYNPEETFTVTANVTLYAQWTEENVAPPERSIPPENTAPKTGDANSFIWVSLLCTATAMLCIIFFIKRRNDKV